MIERRGRLFSLRLAEPAEKRSREPSEAVFEWLDPMILAGTWTWMQTAKGWAVAQPPKRPRRAKR